MNMRYLKLTIHGKVQGVGYRRWFEDKANNLNLKGYVKNLANGDVEAIVVGTVKDVNEIIQLSMTGPHTSKVDQIYYSDLVDYEDYDFVDFEILK